MKTKTKKHPKKVRRNIVVKGKGVGLTRKVQVIGRNVRSRMVRVDVRLADLLAREAKRSGGTITDASRALYESVT
jgi:hypothetical protein